MNSIDTDFAVTDTRQADEVASLNKDQVEPTYFTGAYAVSNWIERTSATVASLWDLSRLPQAITLKTDPKWRVSTDWMTITIAAKGLLTFDWSCSSADGTQNPCFYNVNGVKVQLNGVASSGKASVLVDVGDTFSISCGSGNAVLTRLTISNLVAPQYSESTNFTAAYAAKNWTEYTSATVASLWNLSQLPQAITLKTDPKWRVSTDWMTVTVAATGLIKFDWVCSSADATLHPCSYSVNDEKVILNAAASSGKVCAVVHAGDTFSISCGSGNAMLTTLAISNFAAPVPTEITSFTDAYAIKNWTEWTSATVASLWDLSRLPQALTLNTDPKWRVSTNWMTITVAATGLVKFDWACSSADGTQHPCFYSVNNTKVPLNGAASSGKACFLVHAGDVLAISCGSSDAVRTSLTISNFKALSNPTITPPMLEVVRRLAPDIRMHSREQFFPASVEWYLPQVALYDPHKNLVRAKGSVTAQSISGLGADYSLVVNDSNWDLLGVYSNSPAMFQTYQGEMPTNGVCSAPSYYHLVEDAKNNLIYLTYYYFFPFNGGMGPTAAWTVGPGRMGSEWGFASHEGDWEQLNVVLRRGQDDSTISILAINREAHGDAQWEYHAPAPIPVSSLTPIPVYASWHSHSLRAHAGSFSLGNGGTDYCDDGGAVWRTSTNLVSLDDDAPPWASYSGRFGTQVVVNFIPRVDTPLRLGGPNGPVMKPSWTLGGMRDLYYGVFTPAVQIPGQGTSVPALTTFNNVVHMVYTGAHSSRIYHSSTVNGTDWTDAKQLPGGSSMLAIASLPSCMVLIAPDTDTSKQLWCCRSTDGTNWTALKRIEGQYSAVPALAAFDNALHMVYPSSKHRDPTLYHTQSRNGQDWSAPKVIGNSRAYSVALANFNGSLAMVYSDSRSSQLWVSYYQDDQRGWSTPATIPDQGTSQPAALGFDGSLVVVYTDTKSSQLWVTHSADGKNWPKPHVIMDQGTSVPALTNIPSTLDSEEKMLLVYSDAHSSQLWASQAMD